MVHGKLPVAAAALLILAGVPPLDHARGEAPQRVDAPPPGEWRNAPEYVRLFAPARAHTDAYRAYVSPRGLGDLLRQLENNASAVHQAGAWTPSAVLSSDAFGLSGNYDRAKLARLYGATRALVARGPLGMGGRPTQAWTLISPYPDRSLERLEPGTLLIVLDLTKP